MTLFQPFWEDETAHATYPLVKPLLAHYTTIATVASVLATDEVWLSNPLFMNDHEEVRFGVENGVSIVREAGTEIRAACGSDKRFERFMEAFEELHQKVVTESVLDYYVLCMSEHPGVEDDDGVLSMWRAYGGNGNGAAIVFDAAQLGERELPFLVLGKVNYDSSENRLAWIRGSLAKFVALLKEGAIPTDDLHLAAWTLFERLKLNALFTKHRGFQEEKEWRLVYLKERDTENVLHSMVGYHVGSRGVEPKLKFSIKPIENVTVPDLSLDKLVARVLLGPTISTSLSRASFTRMLELEGKASFVDRLGASSIPLRPQS